MFRNNEIGVAADRRDRRDLSREGIIFHVDAAQATGKVAIDPSTLKVDLMSFFRPQDLRPQGIGALTCAASRASASKRRCTAVGMSVASAPAPGNPPDRRHGRGLPSAREEMAEENKRIGKLRDKLFSGLSDIEAVHVNGDMEQRASQP